MIGGVVEQVWTCVAANVEDGPVLTEEIGRRTFERSARFAFRAEAEAWGAAQEADGFVSSEPIPLAANYHGPTDSPSNCWAVHAEREPA